MRPDGGIKIYGTRELLPADATLEGVSLSEIAQAVNNEEKETSFSYDDVLNYFALTGTEYTPNHHSHLLTEIELGQMHGRTEYTLHDSLDPSLRQRSFITIGDLTPASLQMLQAKGVSLSLAGIELSMGRQAIEDLTVLQYAAAYFLDEYYTAQPEAQKCDRKAVRLMKLVLQDVDPIRSENVRRIFYNRGCGDILLYQGCIECYAEKDCNKRKECPPCEGFQAAVDCVTREWEERRCANPS